jgi:hypothetical protein
MIMKLLITPIFFCYFSIVYGQGLTGKEFTFNLDNPSAQVVHVEAHGFDQLFGIEVELVEPNSKGIWKGKSMLCDALRLNIIESLGYTSDCGFKGGTFKIVKTSDGYAVDIALVKNGNQTASAFFKVDGNPKDVKLKKNDIIDLKVEYSLENSCFPSTPKDTLEAMGGPKRICQARAVFGG